MILLELNDDIGFNRKGGKSLCQFAYVCRVELDLMELWTKLGQPTRNRVDKCLDFIAKCLDMDVNTL